jgi:hypothetical protein
VAVVLTYFEFESKTAKINSFPSADNDPTPSVGLASRTFSFRRGSLGARASNLPNFMKLKKGGVKRKVEKSETNLGGGDLIKKTFFSFFRQGCSGQNKLECFYLVVLFRPV